eukprot:scaffold38939_cov62-Phaeocystis_antarctica.AAC.1
MFPAQLVIRAAGTLRRALTLTLTLSPDRRYAAGTPRRALTLTLTHLPTSGGDSGTGRKFRQKRPASRRGAVNRSERRR